ncbi:ParB/RepB/Spo0J family partition protein [Embleya scabrispora]|uniref:ParB/RepB/Spo0J family partition protein n=1 Tax=Embleya scabrispora TaxID=159449 RepID=UPI0003A4275E|nr:ParB/RepB/Spo0J family partition protein [Embleya scabrispora]MYS79808.1 ParB/RepB/Spo0J family partition protein [Streptomyces sp. SID5474]
MSGPRRGLGKGLESMIPTRPSKPSSSAAETLRKMAAIATDEPAMSPASVPVQDSPRRGPVQPAALYAELLLDVITPNPRQPREVFDEGAMAELVQSIREVGVLQPVVVRATGDGTYELVMGERRWRASREAGLTHVPAIVRVTQDDKLLLDALLENLHRSELNPLEEAMAYEQLLEEFACSHESLAKRIGRSRPYVSNTLRLLKLPAEVRTSLAAGTLLAGHAIALLKIEEYPDQLAKLANRIIREGMTVRTVEEIASQIRSEDSARPAKAQKPRPGGIVTPALNQLANGLKDRFETEVKVVLGPKKGKIVVEFASIDDLKRILASMAPGEGDQLAKRLSDPQAQGGPGPTPAAPTAADDESSVLVP